jgi:hypothetical protein
MKIVKPIWGSIVIISIIILSFNLIIGVSNVQSAMQASQLYNEATTNILGIIAITLILTFWDDSINKSTKEMQDNIKYLAEYSHQISDALKRIEQRISNTPISDNSTTTIPSSIDQTLLSNPPKIEQSKSIETDLHLCPKCNAPMTIRVATSGDQEGKQFYVCSKYPECRGFLPVI